MADWRIASDGETLAWQHRSWAGREAGEQRLRVGDAGALSAGLRQILSGRARAGDTLRVVLGSQHVRVAALRWPDASLSAAEHSTLLLQRWRERLDDTAQWWLGVERSGAMRLATAVRYDLLHALGKAAGDAGLRPLACLPVAGLALRRAACPPEARIAIAEGARETVISLSGGVLVGIRSGWRRDPAFAAAQGLASPMQPAIPAGNALNGAEIRLDGGPRTWLEWF